MRFPGGPRPARFEGPFFPPLRAREKREIDRRARELLAVRYGRLCPVGNRAANFLVCRALGRVAAGCALVTIVAQSLAHAPAASAIPAAQAPAEPTTTTTSTLPALPKVAPVYTDGQNPETLLAKAIELSSAGVDTSALSAAISATQVKLDQDAAAADHADRAAAQATSEAQAALQEASAKTAQYTSMQGAVKSAVIYLYTQGPAPLALNPAAGQALIYAADYADSALSPYGVLATHQEDKTLADQALAAARSAEKRAAREEAQANQALTAETAQGQKLERELDAIAGSSADVAAEVAADHVALAAQAGKELLSASSLQFTPASPLPPPVATTAVALEWAFAELGKPYLWGGTGPNAFDCSGLTQYVWRQAGVSIPRVAADQYSWAIPVPLSRLLPGDLVFYGTTDIHHVGIYIGDGLMINAPYTGTVVQVSSIWWSDLAGFGRVHAPGVPVALRQPPSAQQPAVPAVVPTPGPVPSQTKPPAGWKPKPGETTPIQVVGVGPTPRPSPAAPTTSAGAPPSSASTSTSSTSSTTSSSTSTTTTTTTTTTGGTSTTSTTG
jgi:peptidoglycan DL-endopeptidase CwlO